MAIRNHARSTSTLLVVEEIKRMNRLRQALAQRNGKTLLGAACYFYDPIFLEIAAHVGFDAIWIEMEHAACSP
jgi:2-keto-3-deoxy-L-rhamnonate aldolase RhmA